MKPSLSGVYRARSWAAVVTSYGLGLSGSDRGFSAFFNDREKVWWWSLGRLGIRTCTIASTRE